MRLSLFTRISLPRRTSHPRVYSLLKGINARIGSIPRGTLLSRGNPSLMLQETLTLQRFHLLEKYDSPLSFNFPNSLPHLHSPNPISNVINTLSLSLNLLALPVLLVDHRVLPNRSFLFGCVIVIDRLSKPLKWPRQESHNLSAH